MMNELEKARIRRENRKAMLQIDMFLGFMAGCIIAILVWGM